MSRSRRRRSAGPQRPESAGPAAIAIRSGVRLKPTLGIDPESKQKLLIPPDESFGPHVDLHHCEASSCAETKALGPGKTLPQICATTGSGARKRLAGTSISRHAESNPQHIRPQGPKNLPVSRVRRQSSSAACVCTSRHQCGWEFGEHAVKRRSTQASSLSMTVHCPQSFSERIRPELYWRRSRQTEAKRLAPLPQSAAHRSRLVRLPLPGHSSLSPGTRAPAATKDPLSTP